MECYRCSSWPCTCRDGITIIHGDCGDFADRIAAQVLATDPPYGVLEPGDYMPRVRDDRGGSNGLVRKGYASYCDTYENFRTQIVPMLNLFLHRTERAGVFTGPHIHEQQKPEAIGGVYCPAATGRNRWGYKRFLPVLLYGQYPELNKGCSVPSTIMSNDTSEKNGHPCPKPVSWMKWLVSLVSLPSETILDPFAGSGTTLVAAKQLGRKCIGIEIEERYCEIAANRLRQEVLNFTD